MLTKGETVLKRYRIRDYLGGGGFAGAYSADDLLSGGKVVVVKQSHATLSSIVPEDKEVLERFRREAAVLRRIDSPHVVRYLADGEDRDSLIIVMEFAGNSLNRLFAKAGDGKRTPFGEATAVSVILQSLLGLEAAYREACIAHRDIKLDNLFLAPSGLVQLGDFGIAKLGSLASLTGTKLVGTLRWIAPECFTAPKLVDWRADVYALGIVFSLLLTGRYPLSDPGDELAAALSIAADEPPQGPNTLAPGCCSEMLHELVLKMLAKDPAARFASVGELVEALGGEGAVRRICPECCQLCEWEDKHCGSCGAELATTSPASAEPGSGVEPGSSVKPEPRVKPDLGVKPGSGLKPGPSVKPSPGMKPGSPASPRLKARLLIVREGGKEHVLDLGRELLELGRDEVEPGNRFVSRRHARLRRTDGGWHVEDAGSLNGTFVNAALISEGTRHSLLDGDALLFGDVLARFVLA
ncbi:MAG TPA: FHA domain-containing serine/threonine-protein kinase [Armatimonadota bacterium]|nr:FHA domain-containing serine/threonine-protein kinase [Armatimonadota bacterium]